MLIDDTDVATRLKFIRTDLDEFKSRQLVGGDNTRVRTTAAGVSAGATVPEFGSVTFTISFTADRQDYALTELMVEVFVGSQTTVASLHTDYYMSVRRVAQQTDPAVTTWKVQLHALGIGARTYYIRPTVMSTDSGAIS